MLLEKRNGMYNCNQSDSRFGSGIVDTKSKNTILHKLILAFCITVLIISAIFVVLLIIAVNDDAQIDTVPPAANTAEISGDDSTEVSEESDSSIGFIVLSVLAVIIFSIYYLTATIVRKLRKNKKGGFMQSPSAAKTAFTLTLDASRSYDELLPQAIDVMFEVKQASVSMLQRHFTLCYSKASLIIDQMEELGIIGSFEGSKPRQILISREQWLEVRPELINKIRCSKQAYIEQAAEIDTEQILHDEHNWRQEQLGLSPVMYALYQIDHMDGHEFEYWCSDILSKVGFVNTSVTPASNDQGVDVLAEKDGIKYAIQCKCYTSDLGNTPVQEVNTGKVIYHCHVGVVMTNRYFTTGAKKAADATGVLLWDRDYITKLLETIHN